MATAVEACSKYQNHGERMICLGGGDRGFKRCGVYPMERLGVHDVYLKCSPAWLTDML